MKKFFPMYFLLISAAFSSSALAEQPVKDVSVDARLQVISAQLGQTNALLAKIAGEAPHADPKVIKSLEGDKNGCASIGNDARLYREGETAAVKGKTYKCVISPHWQEQ